MNYNHLYFGTKQEPVKPVILHAGPLNLIYENGFIKHIRLGDDEVLNLIYYAIRDEHWKTYHGTIKNEKIKSTTKGFDITYRSVCSEGSIQYVFDCHIKGSNEGKIEFTIRGESFSGFKRNRIGFCVLHSVDAYAGRPLRVRYVDKSETESVFPELAEPHQPFINIKSMRWEPAGGWTAELKFDGDIFEMEDQRNWSDGTYKTYCTPLSDPLPVEIKMGDTINQKIVLTVSPLRKNTRVKSRSGTGISLSMAKSPSELKIPGIGLCDSSVYHEYSPTDIGYLRPLAIHHLRKDLDLTTDLGREINELKIKSEVLDTPLLLALHFAEDPVAEIERFTDLIKKAEMQISSIILFERQSLITTPSILEKVLTVIRNNFPSLKTGGGSNEYFAGLNRSRFDPTGLDFLAFPSTPQAHLEDPRVMIDNLGGAAGALKTVRSFVGEIPVSVSPVSLLKRSMAFGKKDYGEFIDQLPADVDPKQQSMFAAAWTLGSVKYLAEAGAYFLTYYETAGWKGILQGKKEPALPSLFRAAPDTVFPVYFLMYWLGKLKGSFIIPVQSSHPDKLLGLGLQNEGTKYMVLANLTDQDVECSIHNVRKARIISRLNEKNVSGFIKNPAAVLEKLTEEPVEGKLQLQPFELTIVSS